METNRPEGNNEEKDAAAETEREKLRQRQKQAEWNDSK